MASQDMLGFIAADDMVTYSSAKLIDAVRVGPVPERPLAGRCTSTQLLCHLHFEVLRARHILTEGIVSLIHSCAALQRPSRQLA